MAHSSNRPIWIWIGIGAFALLALPWYALQEGNPFTALPQLFGNSDQANGLTQALAHQRIWLLGAALGIVVTAFGMLQAKSAAQQSGWLIGGAVLGLMSLLGAGFTIGARGWALAWMNTLFGELPAAQFGMGWGGFACLVALIMLLAAGIARRGYFRGDLFVAGSVVGCTALLLLFIALPMGKAVMQAFFNEQEQLSLSAAAARIFNERIWSLGCVSGSRCGVAWNTLFLALATATGTTILGTLLALFAERGTTRFEKPLRLLALLPIITPPFVVGLGLILLFGRSGLVNQFLDAAFGLPPTRWFYGVFGVWLAQMFAFTPIAFMIMRSVVQGVSPSLEEAASTLRATPLRTFMTVTLPLLKPGLLNAFLVGFIESMADFGNPIILGGNYSVLSTEIFFAIVGAQLDQGRAAALALILTGFALAVFALQRWSLGRASYATVTGKGDAGIALPLPAAVRNTTYAITIPWLLFTVVIYVFAFIGGFVETWGRDYSPTLRHLKTAFDLQLGEHGLVWSGAAWNSFWTTVKLAAFAAPITAFVGLLISYIVARTQFKGIGAFEFAALLAFAIPGTVLGVSYILAFNVPPFELTGTALIIVLCFLFRNLPVGVRAGSAAFKQLDKSLDEASSMLGAGTITTLRRVIIPLLKPAIVAALVYSFVRAMTTVSAVIFLVTAETELATTFIIGRVGNGDYGVALAYCTFLIVVMLAATSLIQLVVGERDLARRKSS